MNKFGYLNWRGFCFSNNYISVAGGWRTPLEVSVRLFGLSNHLALVQHIDDFQFGLSVKLKKKGSKAFVWSKACQETTLAIDLKLGPFGLYYFGAPHEWF
jgi:hypothetical protein